MEMVQTAERRRAPVAPLARDLAQPCEIVSEVGLLLVVRQGRGYWVHDPRTGRDLSTRITTLENAVFIARDPRMATSAPQYHHVGDGTFLPANEAAHEECRRWNAWAAQVNARTVQPHAQAR